MPIEPNASPDLRDYNNKVASMEKALKSLKVSADGDLMRAIPRYAPLVKTGTLRPSFTRAFTEATREAQRNTVTLERLGRAVDIFLETMRKVEPLLWRIERPYVLRKWGVVLTLIVAGVAVICQ
ncbi:MAG: hypothetical protein GY832_26320 [Chloroflexi bacterium]|nr:hypothetical protein [Chloroflexota bacterium]